MLASSVNQWTKERTQGQAWAVCLGWLHRGCEHHLPHSKALGQQKTLLGLTCP